MKKSVHRLPEDHQWQALPGHKILVLDKGALRLDYPEDWTLNFGQDSLRLTDRETEEASDCLFQVSIHRLLHGLEWSQIPLETMVGESTAGDERGVEWSGQLIVEERPDFELAWTHGHFFDPKEEREAISRFCIARRGALMALITMDFWTDTAPTFDPVWRNVLSTLRLGQHLDLKGRKRRGPGPRGEPGPRAGPDPRHPRRQPRP